MSNAVLPPKNEHRIPRLSVFILLIIITLVSIVANAALRRSINGSEQAANSFLRLQGLAYHISALEWQSISVGQMSSEIIENVQTTRDEMQRIVGELEQLDPNSEYLRTVRQTFTTYDTAITEEFKLITTGDLEQARILDEEQVDPAFNRLEQALSSTSTAYSAKAMQMKRTGDLGFVFVLLINAILIVLVVRQSQKVQKAIEREHLDELITINMKLEQRVEERTTELTLATQKTQKQSSELQAITEISQTIALVQNIDDLLPLITGLISERFGFYHVGIFLLDDARENAVLQAANSKGGQHMLARKHKLKLGSTSIVGFASQTGRARVALDVGADISYFDNPDLPDTHSEVALPLKIGDRVIGVIDVQSTETAAFKEDELGILTTLANQVAVAIQNTRLYHETRTVLPERRKTPRKKFALSSQSAAGFTYAPDGTIKPAPAIPADDENNNASNQTIILDAASGASAPTLHIPVKLRDQIIGFLNIQSKDPNRNWSENEVELVQTISERAAFALENARLLESVTRRADQEELVARITSTISASTDFDHILQTTIRELGHSLNANRAYIQFGTTSRDTD